MRLLGENKIPCHTLDRTFAVTPQAVRPILRPYVRSEVLQGEPHFLFNVHLFFDA